MQEWLNWHAWKVCRLFTGSPGFESPFFRQEMISPRFVAGGGIVKRQYLKRITRLGGLLRGTLPRR